MHGFSLRRHHSRSQLLRRHGAAYRPPQARRYRGAVAAAAFISFIR